MKGITRYITTAILASCFFSPLVFAESTDATDKPSKTTIHSGPISLNKATVEELSEMKGVGEAKAKAIVTYRDEHGGFKNIEELTQVKGIGQSILESNRPLLSLE